MKLVDQVNCRRHDGFVKYEAAGAEASYLAIR